MQQICCDNLAATLISSLMEMMKSHNSCDFSYPNIILKANTHIKLAQSETTASFSNGKFLYSLHGFKQPSVLMLEICFVIQISWVYFVEGKLDLT